MNFLNNKACKEILTLMESNYKKLKVSAGKCRYNYKCHKNAVHEAIEHDDNFVAMVMYVDKRDKDPSIHFLNYDKKKRKYIDNTIGHWCVNYDYFLIKKIYQEDFMKIENIFRDFRKQLQKELSFITRICSDDTF